MPEDSSPESPENWWYTSFEKHRRRRPPRAPLPSPGSDLPWLSHVADVLEFLCREYPLTDETGAVSFACRGDDRETIIAPRITAALEALNGHYLTSRSVRDCVESIRQVTGRPLASVLQHLRDQLASSAERGTVTFLARELRAANDSITILRRHARPTLRDRAQELRGPGQTAATGPEAEQQPNGKPAQELAGEWLMPMSMADMANRLGNIGIKKARSILEPYELRNAGNRQLWTVRLAGMPAEMARKLRGER